MLEHTFELSELSDVVPPPMAARHIEAAQPAAHAVTQAPIAAPAPKPDAKPITTRALIASLRRRLRVVEREIRSRKSLEEEREQIQRLIAAATSERDTVRRIRAAG